MTLITTKYIRRHYIQKAVRSFGPRGEILEIGSGARWRYYDASVTFNRDASAEPDILGDAENMDFEDERYDSVVCLEVLEHTLRPSKIVEEIYRVLKPGGRLLLTVPFVFEIHDETYDFYRFTKQGLQHLLKRFRSVDIVHNGGKYSVIFHFLRLNIAGMILYPILNNVGHLLDQVFREKNPRITLGYTVFAEK